MLTDMAEMREGESNPRYTDEREIEDDFYMNSPLVCNTDIDLLMSHSLIITRI